MCLEEEDDDDESVLILFVCCRCHDFCLHFLGYVFVDPSTTLYVSTYVLSKRQNEEDRHMISTYFIYLYVCILKMKASLRFYCII